MYDAILDPNKYHGGLTVDSGAPLIAKDATIYGVYTPGTDVPTTGLLIWNVYRGYNSMWLAGFADTTNLGASYYNSSSGVVQSTPGCLLFNNSSMPLPLTNQLAISPELATNISMGRVAVGMVRLYSATTSTTVAALNGTMAIGAITDLRNLVDYSPPDLVQNSCTTKDGDSNIKASEGVVGIVGCDVRDNLKPIDSRYVMTPTYSAVVKVPITGAAARLDDQSIIVLSPCCVNNPPIAPIVNVNTYVINQIPVGSSYALRFTLAGSVPSAFVIYITTGWARTDASGKVITRESVTSYYVGNTGASNEHTGYIQMDGQQHSGPDAWSIVYIVISSNANHDNAQKVMGIDLVINNFYDLDTIGSYRVVRWDNITPNQTLNITGKVFVDGIPTGSIAPYVKSSASVGIGAPDFLYVLRALFASSTSVLRRAYSYSNYCLAKCGTLHERAVVNDVHSSQAAGMYGAASGMITGHASGFLSNVGSALGGMAGSALDDLIDGASHLASGTVVRKRLRGDFGTINI